ncbi:glycosyltransferase [Zobellia sp. OII3]|uniref:glycosyltransferase family 4 protein n=1 Tax=Zobellia sp. OII3 TaxID=2034520 RepID=UPI000B537F13|nr:glycosyltransferase family 4 protein [Zobellia sp. OII3]OWW26240.1 glycosyltransferase [Zobellia sp. OII3]
MKKKILFILHIPPPVNGAAMVGKQIKESQKINSAFETDYINLTTSFTLSKIGKGGFQKIATTFAIGWQVIKALSTKKYDLCYMTLTAKGAGFYKDFLIVLILKLFGKKILYHFHNKGVAKSSEKYLNHLLYSFVFKNTNSIQLSSLLFYDIQRYVRPENVYFCPNGIPEESDVVQKRQRLPETPCKFLFLSNMMEEKGVLVLLEACSLLKEKGLDFECHFIGAWSDISEDYFYERVRQLGITQNIFAHGKQYGRQKIGFFSNADVFVFPTYYHNECFPLVLLEAMQYGLPVISTHEGGIDDIVEDGKTGFLVPRKDGKELARVLERFVVNPSLSEQLGKEGRNRYEKMYTYKTFENNLMAILLEISE